MSFVYSLALGIAVLVAIPFFAHRLRRRRAEERSFAAARLVAPAPPKARRRSKLEDRALFGTRALAIAALALLGASPLVRCSRLSLQRSGGASVAFALVLDDSMSMRALASADGKSRFARARDGALELLASAREGDAVAIVLAGAPARVSLAATTDIGAARAALELAVESDRATDLDGALVMARGLITALPQVDRRIVVLSDLADGRSDGPPLGEGSSIPVWFATPELRGALPNCGLLSADRSAARVRVTVLCSDASASAAREITVAGADRVVVARAPVPSGASSEVTLTLPSLQDGAAELTATLTGRDAIAADDVAPVIAEAGPGAIAVIADTADEAVATGGAPVVEQALAALKLDVATRPLPTPADRSEDLTPFIGVIMDDPPGLTPEQRRAMTAFLDNGGVVMLAVGPHAAAAPLGATLQPMLEHPVTWAATDVKGADPASATGALAESAESVSELAARGRATLAAEEVASLDAMLKWKDGAPLIARRTIGRGEVWIVTLPFAVSSSDLTLRPAFLSLLDAWVAEARARATPLRSEVGGVWTFPGVAAATIEGPSGPLLVTRDGGLLRAVPSLVGAYRVVADGRQEQRVAAPVARELDLRPRAAADASSGPSLGENHAAVDVSSAVALVLLALLACEMALRMWSRGRAEAA